MSVKCKICGVEKQYSIVEHLKFDHKLTSKERWENEEVLVKQQFVLKEYPNYKLFYSVQELKQFINENHFSLVVTSIDWCVFIINKKTWERVGKFDEAYYPAYCEDCDYHLRMIKMGVPLTKSSYLIPQKYQASMTMNKNPEMFYKANHKNRQYFKSKWGCFPEDVLPD